MAHMLGERSLSQMACSVSDAAAFVAHVGCQSEANSCGSGLGNRFCVSVSCSVAAWEVIDPGW